MESCEQLLARLIACPTQNPGGDEVARALDVDLAGRLAAAVSPQGEAQVVEHVDPLQRPARRGLAEVGLHGLDAWAGRDRTPGHRPHAGHVRVGQQQLQQAPADVAGRAGQSDVDRCASNSARARSMCSSVWVAMVEARSVARPAGTAGGTARLT